MARLIRFEISIKELENPCIEDEYTVTRETIDLEYVEGIDLNTLIRDYCSQYGIELISIESISIIKKCRACQLDEPGQRAHMEPGGCLYEPTPSVSRSNSGASQNL